MAVVWIFPTVVTPMGGVVRGRAFKIDPDRGSRIFYRNIRSIVFSRELPRAVVRLVMDGRVLHATADDEGFFEAALDDAPAPLSLGPVDVTAFVRRWPLPVGRGHFHVVPAEGVSIISDFDDTVAVTNVRQKRKMLANALFRNETGHLPVPGMAAFYRALAARAGTAFHYLSGTPVGLMRRTMRFLDHHGFPKGGVVLRHIESAPLDALAYKPSRMAEIAASLPGHRLVLIGDSGEKDPEIFTGLRAAFGGRLRAVFVRNVTGEPRNAERFGGAFVFDRPSEAAAEAARLGLCDSSAVAAVEEAERSG